MVIVVDRHGNGDLGFLNGERSRQGPSCLMKSLGRRLECVETLDEYWHVMVMCRMLEQFGKPGFISINLQTHAQGR